MSALELDHKETLLILEFFQLDFGVKHMIDSLSFLFLLTHIGLNFNKQCLNNRANRENLYLFCPFFQKLD